MPLSLSPGRLSARTCPPCALGAAIVDRMPRSCRRPLAAQRPQRPSVANDCTHASTLQHVGCHSGPAAEEGPRGLGSMLGYYSHASPGDCLTASRVALPSTQQPAATPCPRQGSVQPHRSPSLQRNMNAHEARTVDARRPQTGTLNEMLFGLLLYCTFLTQAARWGRRQRCEHPWALPTRQLEPCSHSTVTAKMLLPSTGTACTRGCTMLSCLTLPDLIRMAQIMHEWNRPPRS